MKRIVIFILAGFMLLTASMAVTLKIIQPEGVVTMTRPAGNEVTLKDATNQIRWWKVISGGIEIINNKFRMPNNDVVVEPQYSGNQIVVIQGENGTISPGTSVVTQGSNKTFTITPNSGYIVSDVIVDDVSFGAITSYTFSNINENHKITAIFKGQSKAKWTVTTITDEGAEVPEVYTNHKCVSCGGYDHECEVINIFISAENAEVTEQN